MQSTHRILAVGVTALALTAFVPAWSQPFGTLTPILVATSQEQAPPPAPDKPQNSTFSGTVAKQGSGYVLRDSGGAIYKLDNTAKAAPFNGKPVVVTGRLDAQTRTIHIETIAGASA